MHGTFTVSAPPTATAIPAQIVAKPVMPEFRPKWYFSDSKVDARPMLWSLENCPEDWEPIGYHNPKPANWSAVYGLRHKPSNHTLYGIKYLPTLRADCGCNGREFQPFQVGKVRLACRRWLDSNGFGPEAEAEARRQQFRAHFE